MTLSQKTKKHLINLLFCVIVPLLAVGCSNEFSTAPGPQNGSSEQLSANPTSTIRVANKGPMPGYRFLVLGSDRETATLDDDQLHASHFIQAGHGGEVRIDHYVRVSVPRWTLPYDATLTISVPDPLSAAAEFGPHPLQFNGYVQIIWEIHEFDLPDDFDYESLTAWYENEDGGYEMMQTDWDEEHRHLTVFTNHFSRYIIAVKVRS